MNELKLADLGEGMREAEIVEWLVKKGDHVKLDQPVVRVETDKAIVEISSPVAGRVREIRFAAGETAAVGEVLIVYDTPQEQANGAVPMAQPSRAAEVSAPAAVATAAPPVSKPRVLAAPAVRKLAYELNIDLHNVPASTSNGRITLEDVRAYAARAERAPVEEKTEPVEEQQPAPTRLPSSFGTAPRVAQKREDERAPLTGLRKRVAEHMERSWRTIPHATSFDEADASNLIALRASLLPVVERTGARLTYLPLLLKLLLPVLKEFPIFNASLDEEKREIVYKRSYHLGVATATPEGLLVPVLRDADQLSVLEIAERLERLIEGAKKRTLAPNELSGSTFTFNNVGSFGGVSGTPIINFPEAAILAVGKIEEKAVVQRSAIIVQPRMPLALSFDHRLIDGALAGAFMTRFKELVECPQQLMLDMI